jgi:diguanylate cyclase (GGDEF)-like protein
MIQCPEGPLPLESPLYVGCETIERKIYGELAKPGGLVRIKGSRYRGKTSLVLRILEQMKSWQCTPVYINWQQADQSLAESTDIFLQWFCANVSRQLGIKSQVKENWNPLFGSKVSCTNYFEDYILINQSHPIVLIFDNFDHISGWSSITKDFFSLLRSWYEDARQNEEIAKLRLILVQNTEISVDLNISQSPFNVGLPITLPDLTLEQIVDLAHRYALNNFTTTEAEELVFMVGGHPYLINLALYHLAIAPELTLQQLIANSANPTGIYADYLRHLLSHLQPFPELTNALQKVLQSPLGADLDHITAYKLEGLGLVTLRGLRCEIACNLYRQYFTQQNLDQVILHQELQKLRSENHELHLLSYQDELTKISNRRHFEIYIEEQWQAMAIAQLPLALILLDIDHFKIFNDCFGRVAGDGYLQKIAGLLQKAVKVPNSLIVRYGGEEFAVILPGINATEAMEIGENIRLQTQQLEVGYNYDVYGYGGLPEYVSVSLGVAACIPQNQISCDHLLRAADQALYESKRYGYDQVTLGNKFLDNGLKYQVFNNN